MQIVTEMPINHIYCSLIILYNLDQYKFTLILNQQIIHLYLILLTFINLNFILIYIHIDLEFGLLVYYIQLLFKFRGWIGL
jgi:hypothetical protein